MSEIPARLSAALAGRYSIERELGQGGMATVYLAEDQKHQRKVADKVLQPELAAAIGAERFLREITTTANLRHPHILPLYDSGEANGFLYYVMPFVAGESLRDRLSRETQLPVHDALRLTREIAEALVYAHELGVIHRDIKPENILLERGHAVVADFGIARAVAAAGGEKLTQTGMAVGTPLYMSPEQASGSGAVDARSDLYSLACVAYEMLAGSPPFSGPTAMVLMARHMFDPVPPLATARPGVPVHVARAVERALAKTPADRFDTAGRWMEALERPPEAPEERLSGRPSGEAVSAPAAEGVAIAVLPFSDMSQAKDQEYFCEGMAEEIMNALIHVEGVRVASRHSAFHAKRQGSDLATIGRTLSVNQVLEGSVRTAGGRLRVTAQLIDVAGDRQLWSERFDRQAEDVFAVQDEIAAGVVQAVRSRLGPGADAGGPGTALLRARTPVADLDAYHDYLQARYFRYTKLDLKAARASYEAALARDPSYARARLGLAEVFVLAEVYGFMPSAEMHERARRELALARESLGETSEGWAIEGWIAWCRDWDTDAATKAIDRALSLDPNSITPHAWQCNLLAARKDGKALDRALDSLKQLDDVSPFALAAGAVSCLLAGRVDEVVVRARRALEIEPGSLLALWVYGVGEGSRGRSDVATETLERAAFLTSQAPFYCGALAWAQAAAGREAQARETLRQLERRSEHEYVPPIFLAWGLAELGEREAARARLLESLAERSGILGWAGLPPFRRLSAEPELADLLLRLQGTGHEGVESRSAE